MGQTTKSFNSASQGNKLASSKQAFSQSMAKQPSPGLKLNPPAPRKMINNQIAFDKAHAAKQLAQSGKPKQVAVPSQSCSKATAPKLNSSKQAFSRAVAKGNLSNNFNRSSQIGQSRQIGRTR